MSIVTYCQPWRARCLAMKSAWALTWVSVAVAAKQSQLFQPIGGLDAHGQKASVGSAPPSGENFFSNRRSAGSSAMARHSAAARRGLNREKRTDRVSIGQESRRARRSRPTFEIRSPPAHAPDPCRRGRKGRRGSRLRACAWRPPAGRRLRHANFPAPG